MENIFTYSLTFLTILLFGFIVAGKSWSSNIQNFLFANRSLSVVTSGAAITSHWLWAIALFVGPAVAYNWGLIGLLWFVIPNAFALITVGYLVHKIRDRYPDGFSLTAYVKENFSGKVSALYQFEFLVVAFGALILAFTAIGKLWAFAALGTVIEPIYASLTVGLITLAFTVRGGIRTSIFTGALQTILWLGFFAVAGFMLFSSEFNMLTAGKNNLETIFDPKFLTTFALAYLITISTSSSGHGHLWQKAFSMPRENIMPAFTVGAVLFACIVTVLMSLSLYAFSTGLPVAAADTAALVGISTLLGLGAVIFFGVAFVGQTSTVIDSSLNYVASLVSMEWFKKDSIWFSRIVMIVFLLVAWVVSWAKIEIWTIMMLMGAVRTVMFVPLFLHVLGIKLKEQLIFYTSLISITGTFFFAWTAKMDKLPIFDMYSAVFGILVPSVTYFAYKLFNKYSYENTTSQQH